MPISKKTPQFTFADDTPPKPKPPKKDPAQKLLDWLQRWNKPTISIRDIRIYGPRSIKKPEIAISSVEILVAHGWLTPLQTRRRDWRHWQVVRKGPIVHPTVVA